MIKETAKGFKDYTGEEAEKREQIREIAKKYFEIYGFEPAETPIIEYEDFVKGDNEKDEAVSDIFRLKDKGNRELALRYELTFALKRIMQNKKIPYKTYRIGQVFRDEPISANRVRQFVSCDADILGSKIQDDAEILSLARDILDKLGVKYRIYVNNRKLINEILEKEGIKEKEEVIREIDKLDKLSEKEVEQNLKKYKAEKILKILKQNEKYFQKYNSYKEIEELKKYCSYYNLKFEFSPSLARGLSYYDGNIFEIKSGIKETILGGGSYTFNGIKSVGFGVSIERLMAVALIKDKNEKCIIISLNQDKESIELAKKLREKSKQVLVYYGKPSKALEYANSYNINYAIFIGEQEVKKKKYKLKDLKTGKEEMVGFESLIKRVE